MATRTRTLLPHEKSMAKMTTVKEMNEKAPMHKTYMLSEILFVTIEENKNRTLGPGCVGDTENVKTWR